MVSLSRRLEGAKLLARNLLNEPMTEVEVKEKRDYREDGDHVWRRLTLELGMRSPWYWQSSNRTPRSADSSLDSSWWLIQIERQMAQ